MTINNTNKKYLSVQQISDEISVKPSWVRSQVFKKKIPFKKIGTRLIRFDLDEVMEWLEQFNENKKGE